MKDLFSDRARRPQRCQLVVIDQTQHACEAHHRRENENEISGRRRHLTDSQRDPRGGYRRGDRVSLLPAYDSGRHSPGEH